MRYKGVEFSIKHVPELEPGFIPFECFMRSYEKQSKKPIVLSLKRGDEKVSVFQTQVIGTDEMFGTDVYYLERLLKFLLWQKGGYSIGIYGDETLADVIRQVYQSTGTRGFDAAFMGRVYEQPFTVHSGSLQETPTEQEGSEKVGRHLDGCRIGFDAGGSDRKVSAVIDGEAVFSEEVLWFPKENSDPSYHYREIVEALKTAASKLPRVDAIGISSAGVYVDNRTMAASLFLKVPEDAFEDQVKDIYLRAAKALGDGIPVVVANDGDVTALAGSMSLQANSVLGLAMGTSEAAGYVDPEGNLTGWLNELAFAPVDLNESAAIDTWSLDRGVGCSYFSQDAVIRLAPLAQISLDSSLSLAEQLVHVQDLAREGDPRVLAIYRTIGSYLGHTLPLYYRFYHMDVVLLLGRVTTGPGGVAMVEEATRVLREDYSDLADVIRLVLPNEASRRVGQSIAAASLPSSRNVKGSNL